MKKIIMSAMLLTTVSCMHGMQETSSESRASVKSSIMNKVSDFASDARVLAVAAGLTVHAVKNGAKCPLTEQAKWPAVAAVTGYSTHRMLQSDNQLIKTVAVLPAAVTLLALLQK